MLYNIIMSGLICNSDYLHYWCTIQLLVHHIRHCMLYHYVLQLVVRQYVVCCYDEEPQSEHNMCSESTLYYHYYTVDELDTSNITIVTQSLTLLIVL